MILVRNGNVAQAAAFPATHHPGLRSAPAGGRSLDRSPHDGREDRWRSGRAPCRAGRPQSVESTGEWVPAGPGAHSPRPAPADPRWHLPPPSPQTSPPSPRPPNAGRSRRRARRAPGAPRRAKRPPAATVAADRAPPRLQGEQRELHRYDHACGLAHHDGVDIATGAAPRLPVRPGVDAPSAPANVGDTATGWPPTLAGRPHHLPIDCGWTQPMDNAGFPERVQDGGRRGQLGIFGDNRGRMLDTHAVARALTNAEFTPAQADAITDAVRQAAEHGDQVTSDQFKTGLAELRTEMAGQRAELTGQIAELAGQIAEQRAEVGEVRTEIANLDTRLSTQIGALDTRLSTQIAGVRTEIASLETRLIRWMVGTVLAAVGLTFGILRFLG